MTLSTCPTHHTRHVWHFSHLKTTNLSQTLKLPLTPSNNLSSNMVCRIRGEATRCGGASSQVLSGSDEEWHGFRSVSRYVTLAIRVTKVS